MLAGYLTVIGSYVTHFVPVIGPFLGGGFDTLAAIVKVTGNSIFG